MDNQILIGLGAILVAYSLYRYYSAGSDPYKEEILAVLNNEEHKVRGKYG